MSGSSTTLTIKDSKFINFLSVYDILQQHGFIFFFSVFVITWISNKDWKYMHFNFWTRSKVPWYYKEDFFCRRVDLWPGPSNCVIRFLTWFLNVITTRVQYLATVKRIIKLWALLNMKNYQVLYFKQQPVAFPDRNGSIIAFCPARYQSWLPATGAAGTTPPEKPRKPLQVHFLEASV